MQAKAAPDEIAALHTIGEIVVKIVVLVETTRSAQRQTIVEREVVLRHVAYRLAAPLGRICDLGGIGVLIGLLFPVDRTGEFVREFQCAEVERRDECRFRTAALAAGRTLIGRSERTSKGVALVIGELN